MKTYEAADLAPDTYIGEYFQPSVKVYKKDDVDEEIENKNMMLEELAGALDRLINFTAGEWLKTMEESEKVLIKYRQSKMQP